MSETRRNGDGLLGKMIALWPVVLSLIGFVATVSMIKTKVDDHEARITKLETGMDGIRSNTDRLVAELLDKK